MTTIAVKIGRVTIEETFGCIPALNNIESVCAFNLDVLKSGCKLVAGQFISFVIDLLGSCVSLLIIAP